MTQFGQFRSRVDQTKKLSLPEVLSNFISKFELYRESSSLSSSSSINKNKIGYNDEYEIRFNSYNENYKHGGVHLNILNNIREYYNAQNIEIKQEYYMVEIDSQNNRKITYYKTDVFNSPISNLDINDITNILWQNKKNVYNTDVNSYLLRFSVNQEVDIKPLENFNPTTIRKISRISYFLNETVRLDTSIVTEIRDVTSRKMNVSYGNTGEPQREKVEKYEVEMELLKDSTDEDDNLIAASFDTILKKVLDSDIIYNDATYANTIQFANMSIGSHSNNNFEIDAKPQNFNKVLYLLRNLHHIDLVNGGIVGNPSEFYTVTHKTDGLRKLLVVRRNGLYLISSPYTVNYILKAISGSNLEKVFKNLSGLVLEGELIPENKRIRNNLMDPPSNKYYFLIYDCLSFPTTSSAGSIINNKENNKESVGDYHVQEETHHNRMLKADIITPYFQDKSDGKNIYIGTKKFKAFMNAYQFFNVMKDFEAEKPLLPYLEDGYIFTPNNMPYNSGNDKIQQGQDPIEAFRSRKLTLKADIVKWKPSDKLTIDFAIIRSFSNVNMDRDREDMEDIVTKITLNVLKNRMLVPFTGSSNFPFDPNNSDNVDSESELTLNLPDGTIVEYAWDYSQKKFIPVTVRGDKKFPNRIEFAIDNWELIQNPISIETLTGSDMKLLRKYHNNIKNNLYQNSTKILSSESNIQTGYKKRPTLLDIGSGRGGDVSKWERNFLKVIAVEPNPENIFSNPDLNIVGLRERILTFYSKYYLDIDSIPIAKNSNELKKIIKNINKNRLDYPVIILQTGGENYELITEAVSLFFNKDYDFDGDNKEEEETGIESERERESESKRGRESKSEMESERERGNESKSENERGNERERESKSERGKGKADIISAMLSLSFFWKDEKTLNLLVKTIEQNLSPNGKFIFFTIDGDLVSEVLNPAFKNGYQQSEITFGEFGYLRVLEPENINTNKLIVSFDKTIVTDQVEYFVYLDDLKIKFSKLKLNLVLKEIYRADKQPFLNVQERTLTKMYSYGYFGPRPNTIESSKLVLYDPLSPVDEISTPNINKIQKQLNLRKPKFLPNVEKMSEKDLEEKRGEEKRGEEKKGEEKRGEEKRGEEKRDKGKKKIIEIDSLPHIPEDSIELLDVNWYSATPVVRIGCIADGSCFFHAVLKAYLPEYAENDDEDTRMKIVETLRLGLAQALDLKIEPNNPSSITIYDTIETFNTMYNYQVKDKLVIKDRFGKKIDFSKEGIKKLLNSNRYLGDEIYSYVADMFNINIYVMLVTPDKNLVNISSAIRENRPSVFIAGNGYHYETIGIIVNPNFNKDKEEKISDKISDKGSNKGLIQTVFTSDDDFLISYNALLLFKESNSLISGIIQVNTNILKNHPSIISDVEYVKIKDEIDNITPIIISIKDTYDMILNNKNISGSYDKLKIYRDVLVELYRIINKIEDTIK